MARRPRLFVLAAGICGFLGALLYGAAVLSHRFQTLDLRVLVGFRGLAVPQVASLAHHFADLCNPGPYAVLALAVAALGVLARRVRPMLAGAATVVAANVTTQVLKPLLAHERPTPAGGPDISAAAWPSGHTTAAMTLAFALVLVVPARVRPVAAAAGGLFTVAVVYALLLLGYHYPSDVLGGFLVAAGWACLALAALASSRQGVRLRLRAAAVPTLLAGAALGAAAALVALLRPGAVRDYAAAHTTFVAGAAVIAAGAVVLAAAASAAAGGGRPAPAPSGPPPRRAPRPRS